MGNKDNITGAAKNVDPSTIKIKKTLPSSQSPIITVVRDPKNNLGKEFKQNSDGGISKRAVVSIKLGIAKMHRIETHKEFVELMRVVGEDPRAAIINASFVGIDIEEEFMILSAREIEKRFGFPAGDREKQKGVHALRHEGKPYNAVGRFKENMRPSCWQYFDRDIDEHTPEKFKNQTFDEWLSSLAEIVPGLNDVSYCHVKSTSARVKHDNKPIGEGNGHLWVKVKDPKDIERFRIAIKIAAAKAGMTWNKPRFSKKEPRVEVGQSLTTITDPSVLTSGRLTFIGKPVVGEGLTVEPLSVSIHEGKNDSIDTSLVVLPEKQEIREITRRAGVAMEVSQDGGGLRISANDLTLDTELETVTEGTLTLRELLERGITGKIRCQTPFRCSSSFAAFVDQGSDGKPFVYDSGTGTTHWLSNSDSMDARVASSRGVIKGVWEKVATDSNAPFDSKIVESLKIIKENDTAEYLQLRGKLKNLNRNVSVVQLDSAVNSQSVGGAEAVPETHNGYARDVIKYLTRNGHSPVCSEGQLYVIDIEQNVWVIFPYDKVVTLVAEKYDGKKNCSRATDYRSIADLVMMIATDDTFFKDAPVGLACPNGFYQIENDAIKMVPLAPEHRQRVKIIVNPEEIPTPMFDKFMQETFRSESSGDESHQVRLVQEIAGAIMAGCMHKYHKAALFYDPYGRSGKGTFERILRALVPPSFVTAVSPFNWEKEYYLASLVGARLNVVGELTDSKTIPAAAFKTVTGGDLLTGRQPHSVPISFRNEAAHLFMSNHFITTSDHSEAFFSRWLLVEFPNSRLRLGLDLDTGLPDRIIENELAGIAHWALVGAKRLLSQGSFSRSVVHDRLLARWRRSTNSLEEFIYDCCERDSEHKTRRSDFYKKYKDWCIENGRKPFSKGRVKELLEHNIGLGITHAKLDGYEIFRGVMVKNTEVALVGALTK